MKRSHYELSVSLYDRVASTIVSLIVLIGLAVLGLLIVVFTSRIFARHKAIPVTLENVATTADPNFGIARDLEPLGAEDAPELSEPVLQETLVAVSDAVSESQARLHDEALDGAPQSSRGTGKGDAREAGTGGEGIVEKVPRAERWEIRFQSAGLDEYARQLDHFGIELAVLSQDNFVHYAYNLSQARPDRKTQSPESERRLYMTWRSGPLQAADRQLLAKAGIDVGGGIVLQFYPLAVENELAQLEKQHAGKRDVNEVRKTIFGVNRDGKQYSFYVVDQKYF